MQQLPRRYEHSVRVAKTAYKLAETYQVDTFQAVAAGLLHDIYKALPAEELLLRAEQHELPWKGSLTHAIPLLHGPLAALEMPSRYPELDAAIFKAIARHTIADTDMSELDMVLFCADALEPARQGDFIHELRTQVGISSLNKLFFDCFAVGISYVIQSRRYLYSDAISIYNHYVNQLQRLDS
ncbi:bis(5'-nucleosyl)-tetraphosphatase (symmetrical) YqeK [Collinsella sp. zg1085]|nr:bis(5'-nucleosyl)-tetraphosphatase (symmetrical) YqeK [Collinsella sp. zg1085]